VSARFPSEFVDRVLALPWRELPRRGAGAAGERAGEKGAGIEFEEHRAYRPGDDPAHVDWQVYARTRRPHVKVERVLQTQVELVLVDCSASMSHGDPSKLDRALRAAAALAIAAVARGAVAEITPLAGATPVASARLQRLSGARELLVALERWEPAGGERELVRGRSRVLQRAPRSLARRPWIFSDLYEIAGWAHFLEALVARSLRPRFCRVLDPEELAPRLGAPVEWIDAETGERWVASDPRAALEGYAERFAAHRERLRQLAERHGIALRELVDPASDLAEIVRSERGRGER
jgi:uncharacterized protein (DUF58 family)